MGDVIYLHFDTPKVSPGEAVGVQGDALTVSACAACKNKNFMIVHEADDKPPELVCTCCRAVISKFGWIHDE